MSACIQEPLATNSKQKQVTGCDFCTEWTDKYLVRGGVQPPPPSPTLGGNGHLETILNPSPPGQGRRGTVVDKDGAWGGGK